MTKIENIKRLQGNGYTLIPLNGKIPAVKNWTNAGVKDFPEIEKREGNYGVALSSSDLVIDVDPRNFEKGDKPLARLVAAVGPLESFTIRTGGGGLHIYFKKPSEILVSHTLKEYPGLEFKSAGRQVVGPGSVHPDTGKTYDVVRDVEVAAAPEKLLNLIKTTAIPFAEIEQGEMKNAQYDDNAGAQGRFVSYLKDSAPLSVEGKQGDATAFAVACRGRDLGLSPAIALELLAAHWNPRCQPPWEDAELNAKVVNAYKYAKKEIGNSSPAADFTAVPKEVKEPAIVWQLTANGEIKKCFYNLLNYLKLPQGGLKNVFGCNEFTGQIEFIHPAPWHKGFLQVPHMIQDHDLKLLKGYLAVRHGFEATISNIEEAVANVAEENKFHPVREYLLGLKWDGKERLDGWLQKYVGVKDGEYTRAVGRKMLCAAVARVMKPGCVFHHVVVLEGPQAAGKSQLCKALGGEWSADFTVDPSNKDTIDSMQGKWIVEMAEMSVLSRSEMSSLKAFITRSTDRIRQAYGRLTREFKRQCIFIGTINPEADGTYLTDTTGNRRFWPIETGSKINFRGVAEIRDQLFAEAVERVKGGEQIFMDNSHLEEEAKIEVGKRHADHPWVDRISDWIHNPAPGNAARSFITARDVFIDALGGIDKQLTRRDVVAIANAMRALGWESVTKRMGVRVVRGYAPKGIDEELSGLL